MADILDAAQSNTPPPPAGGTPMEPPPVPPTPGSDSLIVPPPEAPAPPPPEEPKQEEVKPFEKPKKKSRLGVLLAGLLLLVITLPILFVFVRQQVEIRSRAATTTTYSCLSTPDMCANAGGVSVAKTYCTNCTTTCCKITSGTTPPPACVPNGTCLLPGKTCCSGYSTIDVYDCSGLNKCGPKPATTPIPCVGLFGVCDPITPLTPLTGGCCLGLTCQNDISGVGQCVASTTPTTTCVSPNTCVPNFSECRDAGGTLVSGKTCANNRVCCNIPSTTPTTTCVSPNTCVPNFFDCREAEGTLVSGKTCANNRVCCNIPSTPPPTCTQTPYCIFDNRVTQCVGTQMCDVPIGEMGWVDKTCTVGGATNACCKNPYYCTSNGTCIKNGACTPAGMSPTNCRADASCGGTTPPPQCINIVAYKDGNALSASELAALQPGDTITLAFAPGGAATKVRFRVNAGTWNETTTKNANSQFTWNYTLANVTSFTIEAQSFDGSVWH